MTLGARSVLGPECVNGEDIVHCISHSASDWEQSENFHVQMSSVCTVDSLSIVENVRVLYTPARLEALRSSSQASVLPVTCKPSFFASDSVRGPSKHFVKRSAVLLFVSTRPTDKRFFSDPLLLGDATTLDLLWTSWSS